MKSKTEKSVTPFFAGNRYCADKKKVETNIISNILLAASETINIYCREHLSPVVVVVVVSHPQ